MFTKQFWLGDNGALVRAVRTFGQTAAAMLTVSTFSPFEIGQWSNTLVVSATAAAVSLLMSLDRREALSTTPPPFVVAATTATPEVVSGDPADADFQPPARFVSTAGCGGDLR